MTETTLPGTGAAMDRRIERPHAKWRKRIVRSALAITVLAAAVLLWLLMP
jgi:HlyD family secretion protein